MVMFCLMMFNGNNGFHSKVQFFRGGRGFKIQNVFKTQTASRHSWVVSTVRLFFSVGQLIVVSLACDENALLDMLQNISIIQRIIF
jgi:hypothetical protein